MFSFFWIRKLSAYIEEKHIQPVVARPLFMFAPIVPVNVYCSAQSFSGLSGALWYTLNKGYMMDTFVFTWVELDYSMLLNLGYNIFCAIRWDDGLSLPGWLRWAYITLLFLFRPIHLRIAISIYYQGLSHSHSPPPCPAIE